MQINSNLPTKFYFTSSQTREFKTSKERVEPYKKNKSHFGSFINSICYRITSETKKVFSIGGLKTKVIFFYSVQYLWLKILKT